MRKPVPLYWTLSQIATLWIAADVGYWIILPLFGVSIDYNESPVIIALYYAFWFVASIIVFRHSLFQQIRSRRLWSYTVLSLGFSATALASVQAIALLPATSGEMFTPYADVVYASRWFFLPKSIEILVQQTLITALVIALARQLHFTKRVSIAYAILFGCAYMVMFVISGAPTPYTVIMTLAALASAALFPHLILHVKNGFVYAYAIHFIFYILLALSLDSWPPQVEVEPAQSE